MTLPDLPMAPATDLQGLLLRLLRDDDFTAVLPLLDELHVLGRNDDRRHILRLLAGNAHLDFKYRSDRRPGSGWDAMMCDDMLRTFWWDIYDLRAGIDLIATRHAEAKAKANKGRSSYSGVLHTLPDGSSVGDAVYAGTQYTFSADGRSLTSQAIYAIGEAGLPPSGDPQPEITGAEARRQLALQRAAFGFRTTPETESE